jgi:predicted HicB family RNase H-like nuclease
MDIFSASWANILLLSDVTHFGAKNMPILIPEISVCLFNTICPFSDKLCIHLNGIREVVEIVINDMKKCGESAPAPLSCRKFSGKFVVRIPPNVHRRLAIQAAEEGISLNRLVSAKIDIEF